MIWSVSEKMEMKAALVLVLPVQDQLLRRPTTSPPRFPHTRTQKNRALGIY